VCCLSCYLSEIAIELAHDGREFKNWFLVYSWQLMWKRTLAVKVEAGHVGCVNAVCACLKLGGLRVLLMLLQALLLLMWQACHIISLGCVWFVQCI
jgi:hypothetical protein